MPTRDRSPLPSGDRSIAFASGAVRDATDRAAAWFGCSTISVPDGDAEFAILDWVRDQGIRHVVTAYAPVGPTQEMLRKLETRLAAYGVSLIYVRRPWDEVFWPHAVKGFFPFKDRIPGLLSELSLLGS
jgi:deoxyribodipyrimidine photo-lyase